MSTQKDDLLEAAKRALREGQHGSCLHGCGEMGSCHANLNKEAAMLAAYVLEDQGVRVKHRYCGSKRPHGIHVAEKVGDPKLLQVCRGKH